MPPLPTYDVERLYLVAEPEHVVPGAALIADNDVATAVVPVVTVDDDGQVHFSILPGSVEENIHLLLAVPG